MSLRVLHLVSCSRKKLDYAAPARDLYCSTRFQLTRDIVEHEPWLILSAKHGLVSPDQVLEPYDETLSDMTTEERQAWAARVLQGMPAADQYVIWAGRDYFEFLAPTLRADLPLYGLSIGQQLSYLTKRRPFPSLLTVAREAFDLLIRCDDDRIPRGAAPATDAEWDRVRERLRRSIAAAERCPQMAMPGFPLEELQQ